MITSRASPIPRTDPRRAHDHVYIFAAGGTGGHIYPGVAIAEQLQLIHAARGETAVFHFACSDRAVDRAVLSPLGYGFTPLPARPFSLRPGRLVRFLRSWGPSLRIARRMIRDARERCSAADTRSAVSRFKTGSDAPSPASPSGGVTVVALGGFVAAPFVRAAIVERCPVSMVNIDAVPGKANRLIARFVPRVFSVTPIPDSVCPPSKLTRVAPIVRTGASAPGDAAFCRARLGLDPERPVLLITGGSLGAASLNGFLQAFLARHADALRAHSPTPSQSTNWQILHQTGDPAAALRLADLYHAAGVPAIVEPSVSRMGLWWGSAEAAVSRAGAGSVAEVWANAVPTLFLPYPYHKDDHQRVNAEVLTRADPAAAMLAADRVEPAQNLADAGPMLIRLLTDASVRASLRAALRRLGPADGAREIAEALASQ